ncbi:HECT-domain (ubiquitin-transferase), putative [Plasmodium malariae]|uniref:HECT-domain (Ubiquitin-transferase), putative n=1 Tax=Plasmodium malariae TaxID=5858 RepID=A0A1C3KZI4_PLAMA|nr:HECT-domain (ubiquitin-transferase), putative [Plasmodium malariae]
MDFHLGNKYYRSYVSENNSTEENDILEVINNVSLKTRKDLVDRILKKRRNEENDKLLRNEMENKKECDNMKKNNKKYNDTNKNNMYVEYDEKTTKAMELAMYESLGRVMGMCVCIASALNICFNPIIWKKICGMPLELQDLCDYDFVAVEMLKTLKMLCDERTNGWNVELKQSLGDMTFLTEDSGGNSIELIRNGVNVPINFDNLELFIRLMTRCKMNESSKGIRYLLKGFSSVIPLGRLRLLYEFTNVEHMVCGEREINLDVLKAHTWSNDLKIKHKLFTVLEEFTNEQLQSFLRFVSGRSRLPTTKNDWYMIIDVDNGNHNFSQIDQRLPTAVTCGFRLLLPQYSTLEILKERLLYAIKNCTAIDLDTFVVHDQMQLMYEE